MVDSRNVVDAFRQMALLMRQGYTFVALDTEFPGCTAEGSYRNYTYANVQKNVTVTSLIQVAFSLYDAHGRKPPGISTFSFHFKWNTAMRHNPESIAMLVESGVDFDRCARYGIDAHVFRQLMIDYGMLCNPSVGYITYHGSFDMAYLVRLASMTPLPASDHMFRQMLAVYFPVCVDLKSVASHHHGGLESLSASLKVQRTGSKHNAGSDAVLTGDAFFKYLKSAAGNPFITSNQKIFGLKANP